MRRPAGCPLWLAGLLLLSACAGGGASDAAFRAAANAEMARRPEFYRNGEARAWQVRKDGTVRGLIWGTLHVGYGDDTALPAPIRARFYGATDLTVEAELDRLPGMMRSVRAAIRRANTAYDAAAVAGLDEPTRRALAGIPDTDGRDLSLRGLAGRVAAAATRTAPDPAALPDQGIADMNLIAFARQQDRPVHGLERRVDADPTLAAPNGPEAAGRLRQALRRMAGLREFLAWLRSAYRMGDVAGLAAATTAWQADADDLRRSDENRDALFTRRNAAWLPQLDRLFAGPGDHFVAVGAGHLLGSDGLVTLLQGRGYDVTPCPQEACR